jgi:hypothetical protein
MAVRRRTQTDMPMAGGGNFAMDSGAQADASADRGVARKASPMNVSGPESFSPIVENPFPGLPSQIPEDAGGSSGAGGGAKSEGSRERSQTSGGPGTRTLSTEIPLPNITGGGQTGVQRRNDAPQATGQIPPPAPSAGLGMARREPQLFGSRSRMPLFGKAGGLLGGGIGVPGAVSGGEPTDISALIAQILKSRG